MAGAGPFLDDLSPYEIEIVDVGSRPSPDQADELALVVSTHDAGDPLLPRLPGSRVRFSGRDDCVGCSERAGLLEGFAAKWGIRSRGIRYGSG
ncbi:hypothetical protein HNR21_001048 [Actinomadura cellulosilytica]|uniref:Uncharacterized protein n=1 Tax=Thermomonospora cellulosilytica TaxID=1411118 RepID=A0A7W3MUJ3_9ACTN|nr:hypothetical protein [Thermomonospora cellulosilytica]